jgi:hypothetical protein
VLAKVSEAMRGSARKLFLILGAALACVSVAAGAHNAWTSSIDFRWVPTHLLVHHIDPWKDDLAGDPLHAYFLAQDPIYLALLYVILAPLGLLSYSAAKVCWCICNVLFGLGAVGLAARFYHLTRRQGLLVLLLFLCGTPFRNSVGNGQQDLLVMICIAAALCLHTRAGPLFAGVSYIKYSFGPSFFFYLWFRKSPVSALLSLVPVLAGTLIVAAWLHTSPLQIALDPLASLKHISSIYDSIVPTYDLTGQIRFLERWLNPQHHGFDALQEITPFVVTLPLTWWISRKGSGFEEHGAVALITLSSVMLYLHNDYDYVMFLFPLCLAIRYIELRSAQIILILILFFWFGVKILHILVPGALPFLVIPGFLLLIAMFLSLVRLARTTAAMPLQDSNENHVLNKSDNRV